MLFTTSWDDGYESDLRIAELLDKHGCKGTFYVCPFEQHGEQILKADQIKDLSLRHEIGAHSMTHPKLTKVSVDEAKFEIEEGRKRVQDITGKECDMFCYPFGELNGDVKRLVIEAGFRGARTTENLKFSLRDPFELPVTFQVTPFPWRKKWSKWWHPLDHFGPARAMFGDLRRIGIQVRELGSWSSLAKALFAYAKKTDQHFFHLWGHSREVDKFGMQGELEEFLGFVEKEGVECVTNGQLTSHHCRVEKLSGDSPRAIRLHDGAYKLSARACLHFA